MADNSRMLRRLFDQRVRDHGLTAAQARLLLSLHRNRGENQAFHAERLEVEPITLTRIVDRMEEAGWICRKPDPGDRRARILHVTDKAQDILAEVAAIVDELFADTFAGLDPVELDALSGLLDRIGSNLAGALAGEPVDG